MFAVAFITPHGMRFGWLKIRMFFFSFFGEGGLQFVSILWCLISTLYEKQIQFYEHRFPFLYFCERHAVCLIERKRSKIRKFISTMNSMCKMKVNNRYTTHLIFMVYTSIPWPRLKLLRFLLFFCYLTQNTDSNSFSKSEQQSTKWKKKTEEGREPIRMAKELIMFKHKESI